MNPNYYLCEAELKSLRKQAIVIYFKNSDLTNDLISAIEDWDVSPQQEKKIKSILTAKYKSKLKIGDIVSAGTYRNQFTYIFNGKQLEDLYFKADDYGTVPPNFYYPNFPIGYWSDAIDYGNLYWVHKKSDIGQLIAQAKKQRTTTVNINGEQWEFSDRPSNNKEEKNVEAIWRY
jgi:hypothetical protein